MADMSTYPVQSLKLTFNKITNKCVGKSQTMNRPMIIMHGLFGNSNNNRTMANSILEIETQRNPGSYRDIYLLNMRNHGTSPCDPDMAYGTMSQDIFKFIKDHNLEQPILVGHSMGGKVAIQCVLENPRMFPLMVCIENSPVVQPINKKFIEYIQVLQNICQDPNIKTLAQARDVLDTVEKNSLISGFLLTMLQRKNSNISNLSGIDSTDQPGLQSKLPLDILKNSLANGSISGWNNQRFGDKQYFGPVLFIKGSKSDYIKEYKDWDTIQKRFPKAVLEVVKDAGHFVNAEQPRDCASLITRFLIR